MVWIETYELCQKLKGLSYVACSGAAYSLFLTVDEGVQPLKTGVQICNAVMLSKVCEKKFHY